MLEDINTLIENFAQKYSDERMKIFKVEVKSLENTSILLHGTVLEKNDLILLLNAISKQYKHLTIDISAVEILRKPENLIMEVGVNLTSAHTSPSFLAEMSSQMLCGEKVEILAEQGRWVYTRQKDGYLAWTYKPYLIELSHIAPTHIVLSPAIEVRTEPDSNAPILSRIFCGTQCKAQTINGDWAQIISNVTGWIPLSVLRQLQDLPQTDEARRNQISMDAHRMIGIPYLWGGTSGNGIDCSGLARLLHKWVGIDLPRDADLQSTCSKQVSPPFQPGDLLFFGEGDSNRRITHVGISLGGWKMVHSSRSRNGVYIDNVQEKESLRSIFSHAGTFINS